MRRVNWRYSITGNKMLSQKDFARVFGLRLISASVLLCAANAARAEDMKDMDHSQMKGMDHSQHEKTEKKKTKTKKPAGEKSGAGAHAKHAGHGKMKDMSGMKHEGMKHEGMDHAGMDHSAHAGMDMQHGMTGFFGPYSITREGSGTSWLPDASPHEGIHSSANGWMFMTHGYINGIYDHQGSPRGGDKFFVPGMVMGMAQKQFGDSTLGFRAMLSPVPFMGPSGYPLLLATGETADGKTHLIDRQHPHDLFMELAAPYSRNISETASIFLYAGLPGEPALGPPAFMHRTSGVDNPEAPITHHWLHSTHIPFGGAQCGSV